MNVGFSNLTTLKRHLLPDTWESETSLDEILAELGLGVASQIEDYCARKFARAVNDTFQVPADTMMIQLPRFPIAGTPTLELRTAGDATWTTEADSIDQVASEAGILYLTAPLGTVRDRVRVTYTGGFWWNTQDAPTPDDELPAGATALPSGILLAWLLQCQTISAARELLATKALPTGKAAMDVVGDSGIRLLDTVKDSLQPYRVLAA
jgi:hypothetical protein